MLGTVDTQQAALTNAENMIKMLVEKVSQLEAKLSTITPDDRKSHFYAFVYSERRYCKAVMLTRPTVSRPRPRPEVFNAKAKASHFKG